MRIGFLIRSLGNGGAERQLTELALGLHRRGHGVTVYVFYALGGPYEARLIAQGVTLVNLLKGGRWDTCSFLRRLRARIRRDGLDVLHSYLVTANVLSAVACFPSRSPALVWGVRASRMALQRYDWLARAEFQASRILARRASLIISNSKSGASDHVRAGYPADRMAYIPNGIDTDHFQFDSDARDSVRREWGLTADTVAVGSVGRLDPMKDHRTLLEAVARTMRVIPAMRLICVGEGPAAYADELRALAKGLGIADRVTWVAPRLDMPAVYSALDALVSSSAWGEGFSNVIAEALSCALPVIATSVGAASELIGDPGRVVAPGDAAGISESLAALLRAGPPERCYAKREEIVRRYSVQALTQQTEAALLGITGAPIPPAPGAAAR